MITIEEVRTIIEDLKRRDGRDPEGLHGDEDDMLQKVLEAIAGGCKNPKALAAEALKVKELRFPRWTA